MAKKVQSTVKLQLPAVKGDAGAARGHGAWPARREHHGFLQAVQRQDGKRAGRHDYSRAGDDLQRPDVHIHPEDAAGSELLKRAAGIVKGSPEPNRNKVAKVTRKQVEEIAKMKLPDLNTAKLGFGRAVGHGHGPQHGHRSNGITE